jgi:hypothetical protein
MPRITSTTYVTIQHYLNRAAVLLACMCAVSVLLYGTFLLLAVAHAASQTDAQRQVQQISANLGDLEAQYLSYSRGLTREKAIELGFVMPQDVTTVFATAALGALSLRSQ